MLLPPVIAFASTVVSSARTQRVLVPPSVDSEIVQNYFSLKAFAYCCIRSLANVSSVSVCNSAALAAASSLGQFFIVQVRKAALRVAPRQPFLQVSHFPNAFCCIVKNSS